MNIFYTSKSVVRCALDHCVRHRNKMIVEYAQLLSTAHHVLDGDNLKNTIINVVYKQSHTNHPSAVWVRQSVTQYLWVAQLAFTLCELYRRDTGRVHKSFEVIRALRENTPRDLLDTGWREPPACVDDTLKIKCVLGELSTTDAYKQNFILKFIEWQTRSKPLSVFYYGSVPTWITKSGLFKLVKHSPTKTEVIYEQAS